LSSPPKVVVIAGPTASGKSALGLAVARAFNGTIINADSQQCYEDLPLLTARPSATEMAEAPHRLFGELGPRDKDSAPAWAKRAAAAITETVTAGSLPILVGGSGLYLQALMIGMPAMPEVPGEVRDTARRLIGEIGNAAFHDRLAARDPVTAARLKPGDTQRILRAWEVIEATGRSISAWQKDAPQPAIVADYHSVLILPPRADTIAAIEARFAAMVGAGALEEVAALRARGIADTAPVMRILGARPLVRHLNGELDLAAAVNLATTATRQYAKRQTTWFRHQFNASETLLKKYSESLSGEIFAKIRRFLLTSL